MSQQREQVTNEPSLLLKKEENEKVFAALGHRRITRATAVAQVYHAHPDPKKWIKFKTGVVCFVKDNLRKSYYIRLLEINATKGFTLTWEQELYHQFTYTKDLPRFHHFPGDNFMVGLNFSDEHEADKFHRAIEAKIEERHQKRQTLKQKKGDTLNTNKGPSSPPNHPAPPLPNTLQPSSPLQKFSEPASHNISHSSTPSSSNKGQKTKKKPKINKSDIGVPTDFKHLAHVGWDPSTGAFDSSNIGSAWKKLLDTVGVSDAELKDKKTAKFIYDFVEECGGIEKANQQLEAEEQKFPPPLPGHGGRRSGQAPPLPPPHDRGPLPPPPPNRNAPPPPPSLHRHHAPPPPSRSAPPPPSRSAPPPPPSRHGGDGGGNVPAPPPPPPVNVPAPSPPPLISSGGPPPPPSQANKPSSNLPVVSDARANLMESIRAGKTLHKVEEQSSAEKKQSESNGIAGALARALASRKDAIADTDSSEDEGEYDEDEEWSD